MVLPSTPRSLPTGGLSELTASLAPTEVRVSFSASNALPYRLEWGVGARTLTFYGLTPDAAADEALRELQRGHWQLLAHDVTEPNGQSDFAEALRDLIESAETERPTTPRLRLVPSQP